MGDLQFRLQNYNQAYHFFRLSLKYQPNPFAENTLTRIETQILKGKKPRFVRASLEKCCEALDLSLNPDPVIIMCLKNLYDEMVSEVPELAVEIKKIILDLRNMP